MHISNESLQSIEETKYTFEIPLEGCDTSHCVLKHGGLVLQENHQPPLFYISLFWLGF